LETPHVLLIPAALEAVAAEPRNPEEHGLTFVETELLARAANQDFGASFGPVEGQLVPIED
jgi:hypothetical protein